VRRLIGPLVGVLVAVGGVLALLLFFSGRDSAGVRSTAPSGPGQLQPDRGHRHVALHAPRPDARPGCTRGRCDPPTSGPLTPVRVPGDRVPLGDDQILHALELGNVVIFYPGDRTVPVPGPLRAVQRRVAGGRSTPTLIAVGQAVILSPRGGSGIVAAAWRHLLHARDPGDPRLLRFAQYWLSNTPDL